MVAHGALNTNMRAWEEGLEGKKIVIHGPSCNFNSRLYSKASSQVILIFFLSRSSPLIFWGAVQCSVILPE